MLKITLQRRNTVILEVFYSTKTLKAGDSINEGENAFAFIFSLSSSLLYKQGHPKDVFKTAAHLRAMRSYIATYTFAPVFKDFN